MKSTLALFTRGSSVSPMALTDWADGYSDYVRLTEYVEVDFPALSAELVLPQQLAAIDRDIEEITKEFAERLDTLKTRKANLLALTDQREVAA